MQWPIHIEGRFVDATGRRVDDCDILRWVNLVPEFLRLSKEFRQYGTRAMVPEGRMLEESEELERLAEGK